MIRVVVAEDSPTARALLVALFSADPDLEVVGEVADGAAAVEAVKRLDPDILTMDIRMPRMDGFEATKQIMEEAPTPIVLVTGHVDLREAEATMHAMRLGALWVLEKPPGPDAPNFERASQHVVDMVKRMSRVRLARRSRRSGSPLPRDSSSTNPALRQSSGTLESLRQSSSTLRALRESSGTHQALRDSSSTHQTLGSTPPSWSPAPQAPGGATPSPRRRTTTTPTPAEVGVVAISASAGGPQAISQVLGELRPDFPAPILVVQHIVPGFVQGLATSLSQGTGLTVKVAEAGERARRGTVYLGPDDLHLGISSGGEIILSNEAPVRWFRPSASYLFNSIGQTYGESAVGVVMTGMGRDGLEGLRELRLRGGVILAQDRESSAFFGMARAALEAELVHEVLPLGKIGSRLARLAR